MKQRLVVRKNGPYKWCVTGEGLHFWITTEDRDSALFVAHHTRNQWYPRACVVVDDIDPRDERFERMETRDQMWSDWNE